MSRKNLPSQERLQELLDYDAQTGALSWKMPTATHVKPGDAAFACKTRDGYLQGGLDMQTYLAHRIVWKLVYGYNPDQIDHIDGNRSNNALSNLRECTVRENNLNKGVRSTSKTGVTGVTVAGNRYCARIKKNGEQIFLGSFGTIEEAAEARRRAEVEYGFHRNNGKRAATKRMKERWVRAA